VTHTSVEIAVRGITGYVARQRVGIGSLSVGRVRSSRSFVFMDLRASPIQISVVIDTEDSNGENPDIKASY
jgi:hypothetical protein